MIEDKLSNIYSNSRKYQKKPLSLSKLNSIDKGAKDTQISRILVIKTYYQKSLMIMAVLTTI